MGGLIYLLDSNVISEPTKREPDSHVMEMLSQHEGSFAIGSVTWHELVFGVRRMPEGRRRDLLERYVEHIVEPDVPILPYDQEAAQWFASERARLSSIGLSPSYADGQIAGVAASRGLILVTRNVRDFENFENLRIANWFEHS
jgi:tRNA(fMet)-specific endonuclease VapC